MIVDIALNTGWSIDYVGWHVDLPRLISMNKSWARTPPMNVMLAAYCGYKGKKTKTNAEIGAIFEQPIKQREMSFAEMMQGVTKTAFAKPTAHTWQSPKPDAGETSGN